MAPADWAQRARDDAERYARENPSWCEKDAARPRRVWSPAELERFAVLAAETREEFWQRHEDAGTTYGLKPCPPLRRAKRGPSREVLGLRARVAELERELAGLRAPASSSEWLAEVRARIAGAAA